MGKSLKVAIVIATLASFLAAGTTSAATKPAPTPTPSSGWTVQSYGDGALD